MNFPLDKYSSYRKIIVGKSKMKIKEVA